jgi:hypothetical protein
MKVYHTKSGKSKVAIDVLIEKFKDGDLNRITAGIKFKVPEVFPSSGYSMRNKMMCYYASDSITTGSYKFWKANGRQVTGKAIYIFAPMMSKSKDDDGEEKVFVYAYKLIPTFPIEHTEPIEDFEGDVLQAPELEPADLPPLTDIAIKLGLKVNWKPVPFDRWADYYGKGQCINMGTDSPKVFFHELAHALHEAVDSQFKERSKQYKEVVAEFGSAVMMNVYLNEDTSGNAWDYMKMFAENPTDAVERSLIMIQKMFTHLNKLQKEI